VKVFADTFESFVGTIGVAVGEDGAVVRVTFLGAKNTDPFIRPDDEVDWNVDRCSEARRELEEYFRNERRSFDVALAPRGTEFQLAVWEALTHVPFGATATSGEIAARAGRPKGSQAVGQANHVNPIPIIVPCHRIIGTDQSMTGFGGGIDVKRALLDFERGQQSLFGG
jgi:methylated-DNA-[protein]-cysteine S-methyltransferase